MTWSKLIYWFPIDAPKCGSLLKYAILVSSFFRFLDNLKSKVAKFLVTTMQIYKQRKIDHRKNLLKTMGTEGSISK